MAAGGYGGVALLMALENIVPPIPSEVIMGLGGMGVARGDFDLTALLIAGTVGSVVGNYAWFEVGRRIGHERLRPFVDRWGRWLTLNWSEVERVVAFFNRHGGPIVFAARFMPFFRTMISLPAGMARMGLGALRALHRRRIADLERGVGVGRLHAGHALRRPGPIHRAGGDRDRSGDRGGLLSGGW